MARCTSLRLTGPTLALASLVWLTSSWVGTQSALGQTYVGAARCGECHAFAYEIWATSPHAKAHLSLTPEQLKDGRCNNCHTQVEDTETRFAGVQCERCHGAGKYYQPAYVMKDRELARAVGLVDPTPASCQQCHTEGSPGITPFDFKTMWSRIDHGKAAREAWERSRKPAATASGAAHQALK